MNADIQTNRQTDIDIQVLWMGLLYNYLALSTHY